MQRHSMLIPNALVLACAIILFYQPFLSGHFTWIGSLVVITPLISLFCCLRKHIPWLLQVAAFFLNSILFFSSAYAFIGTGFMLAKTGAIGVPFCLIVGVLWAAALGLVFFAHPHRNRICAVAMNVFLIIIGALGLYARYMSGWKPWMSAVLFASLMVVACVNIYLIGFLPFITGRKYTERT